MVALACGLQTRGHQVTVATFYPDGAMAGDLDSVGVRRVSLGKSGRWDMITLASRLRRLLVAERPEIVHSYLPPANVAAALVRPFVPDSRLVWGVRATFMDLTRYDWFTQAVDLAERRLSKCADLIIANSEAGIENAISRGFARSTMHVVYNGIDTQRFAPQPEAAQSLRREWGVAPGEEIVGLTARLDPIKDHETFLRAFQHLAEIRPGVRGVLLGDGPAAARAQIQQMAAEFSVWERLIWLPFTAEPAAIYSAFDIACSSSAGEGFSNALAEAMACGVSCVATRVGDSATILGDTGLLVPPRDPQALAQALSTQLDRRRADPGLGEAMRRRIEARFSMDAMIENTEALLQNLLTDKAAGV